MSRGLIDYFVAFVSDCTAAGAKEAHEATLYTMGRHFGTVLTSEDSEAGSRARARVHPANSSGWG